MKKIMYLTVLVVLLVVPMASYTGDKIEGCKLACLDKCSDKDDKTFQGCFTVCMDRCMRYNDPPPKPTKSSQERSENNSYIVIASNDSTSACAHAAKSSGDSCCRDTAGNTKGYCPEGYPYFKDVITDRCPSGTCYKNGYDCEMGAGFGFCYTCSICK